VFAGLWEGWKDPATNEWLTCTIITGEPNEFVREIHTRMPVILPEEQHDAWLLGEAGKEILIPFPADRMKAWPISPRVNRFAIGSPVGCDSLAAILTPPLNGEGIGTL
jgi:putative SOS response-associated peptidase YedK